MDKYYRSTQKGHIQFTDTSLRLFRMGDIDWYHAGQIF
jgi:hypothetical protein